MNPTHWQTKNQGKLNQMSNGQSHIRDGCQVIGLFLALTRKLPFPNDFSSLAKAGIQCNQ